MPQTHIIQTTLPSTSTDIDVASVTSIPAAAATITYPQICDVIAEENAAAVVATINIVKALSYVDCLRLCQATLAYANIFCFGDYSEDVVFCHLMSIPAAETLDYDTIGEPFLFNFADKTCPLVDDPGW